MNERLERLIIGALLFAAFVAIVAGVLLALGEYGDALLLDTLPERSSIEQTDHAAE